MAAMASAKAEVPGSGIAEGAGGSALPAAGEPFGSGGPTGAKGSRPAFCAVGMGLAEASSSACCCCCDGGSGGGGGTCSKGAPARLFRLRLFGRSAGPHPAPGEGGPLCRGLLAAGSPASPASSASRGAKPFASEPALSCAGGAGPGWGSAGGGGSACEARRGGNMGGGGKPVAVAAAGNCNDGCGPSPDCMPGSLGCGVLPPSAPRGFGSSAGGGKPAAVGGLWGGGRPRPAPPWWLAGASLGPTPVPLGGGSGAPFIKGCIM
mmetsp:Transcript_6603/g.23301  ORF Transcript_6603/g.23301 Transcript_6603/m.23301 type:complete len:264 (-) Transcript_6603:2139-2930(-)